MSDEEIKYDLEMPFVTVTSKGGPHEDGAYVAGWEMGALDALLEHARPPLVESTIHASNVPQADLVAMKHGYDTTFTEYDDEWSFLKATSKDSP
jgi:hypothetical protein